MEYLNEYDLWLQVIDENGQEVFLTINQTAILCTILLRS